MTMPVSISAANNSADRATFENCYAGKAPWDIGKPQGTFAAIADRVTGPVLDAGCGTGEHALLFAARGHRVTGIDFVEEALRRGRAVRQRDRLRPIPRLLRRRPAALRPGAGAGGRAGRPAVPDVFQRRGTGSGGAAAGAPAGAR